VLNCPIWDLNPGKKRHGVKLPHLGLEPSKKTQNIALPHLGLEPRKKTPNCTLPHLGLEPRKKKALLNCPLWVWDLNPGKKRAFVRGSGSQKKHTPRNKEKKALF
jgi:hypothetical protein